MVDIAVGEHAELIWIGGGAAGVGVRAIVVVHVKLVFAFDLKNALRGPRAE